MNKNTKIVCTLGPASSSIEIIQKMALAGMNVARLNFSHGDYKQFEQIIKNIRTVSEKLKTPIAILQDLQGPKIRIAKVSPDGMKVKKGQKITIGKNGDIDTDYENFAKDVHRGELILIDDGLIEMTIEKIESGKVQCTCLNSGIIKLRKGVNVPGGNLRIETLTKKDQNDLEFGLSQDVDYIALSFVRTAKDITDLKKIIRAKKSDAHVMAKIETRHAVQNLEEIIKTADAIMIARGDLGIEIPPEQVPIVQKKTILLCNQYGKPVITATHILNSMVENPRATRAEISDAANAIFDHSDALMLSNETAVGKYPVEAVKTLAKVASATEKNLQEIKQFLPYHRKKFQELAISNATCLNAAELALDIHANFIVAVSISGYTAQHIAKHRLYTPLITITQSEKIRRKLALVWGCNMIFIERIDFQKIPEEVENLLKKNKIAKKGDEVVIVMNASKKQKIISTIVIK